MISRQIFYDLHYQVMRPVREKGGTAVDADAINHQWHGENRPAAAQAKGESD